MLNFSRACVLHSIASCCISSLMSALLMTALVSDMVIIYNTLTTPALALKVPFAGFQIDCDPRHATPFTLCIIENHASDLHCIKSKWYREGEEGCYCCREKKRRRERFVKNGILPMSSHVCDVHGLSDLSRSSTSSYHRYYSQMSMTTVSSSSLEMTLVLGRKG